MSGALLDTSVLIAGDEAGALELPPTAAISIVSVGELHAGVRLARSERIAEARRAKLAAVREAFLALPVEETVAERYGHVLAVARAERRTVKATDLLIIATAAAGERELFTRDAAQARLARAAGVPATEIGVR